MWLDYGCNFAPDSTQHMKRSKHRSFWTFTHKWIGLLTTVFILVFCISGWILNHRSLFTSCSVPRGILPSEYHIKNYNNGVIKGTLRVGKDTVVAYGNSGIWMTDTVFSNFADFNTGLPEGSDNRNIRNIVRTKDGTLWAAAQFGLYRHDGRKWDRIQLPGCNERIADVTLDKDSASVIALSRSALYRLSQNIVKEIRLRTPASHTGKVSMFKTIWMLHSGELFGLAGRLMVDAIALILVFLCVTGIILFILPYSMRKKAIVNRLRQAKLFKWNFKWHNRTGYATVVLTILIAFTGMCLRPPLMIPFVMTHTPPIPGSALDNDNAWHDKLRAIRWDRSNSRWLISTSDGFFISDENFANPPARIESKAVPPVSPMGITVFESAAPGQWLVGSFSGMFFWNPEAGTVRDYFSGRNYTEPASGRPVSGHAVAGYSADLHKGGTVFDYSTGSDRNLPQSQIIGSQPMSLWNFALELHVGRCYNPILGPFSALFIFLAGLIMILILVSGIVVRGRRKNKQTQKSQV